MRDQGSGWLGPDVGEIDDAECVRRAKGELTARSSGAGRDFQYQVAGGGRQEPSLARLG